MSINQNNMESNEENLKSNIADELKNEKKSKGISFKTIFMLMIVIAIVLFMLAKGILSLKTSLTADRHEGEPEVVTVDNRSFNITRNTRNPDNLLPPNDPENGVDPENPIPNEVEVESKPVIIKGRFGLAKGDDKDVKQQETQPIVQPIPQQQSSVDNEKNKQSTKIVKAEVLKLNPNLSIYRGTFIKCSLRTALISQISGDVGCIISDDVYSANGTTLLIEKGSIVNGAFRRASVNQGDDRVFVLWEEIRTPNNLIIRIDSGASDVLGGQGISGWVDNHFWTRFGNAVLVSLMSDLSSAAASRLQKEHTFTDLNNTTQGGTDVAKSIIEKNVDIPPTIYRNHGDSVGIYTNQDIDFSDVYKLEYRK